MDVYFAAGLTLRDLRFTFHLFTACFANFAACFADVAAFFANVAVMEARPEPLQQFFLNLISPIFPGLL